MFNEGVVQFSNLYVASKCLHCGLQAVNSVFLQKLRHRIVTMDFYGCNDIPLGNFLERYCFRRTYICPSSTCDTPMIDHERRFVHETGCIQVSLRDIESLPDNDSLPILFWSSCTVCKLVSWSAKLKNSILYSLSWLMRCGAL